MEKLRGNNVEIRLNRHPRSESVSLPHRNVASIGFTTQRDDIFPVGESLPSAQMH